MTGAFSQHCECNLFFCGAVLVERVATAELAGRAVAQQHYDGCDLYKSVINGQSVYKEANVGRNLVWALILQDVRGLFRYLYKYGLFFTSFLNHFLTFSSLPPSQVLRPQRGHNPYHRYLHYNLPHISQVLNN